MVEKRKRPMNPVIRDGVYLTLTFIIKIQYNQAQ